MIYTDNDTEALAAAHGFSKAGDCWTAYRVKGADKWVVAEGDAPAASDSYVVASFTAGVRSDRGFGEPMVHIQGLTASGESCDHDAPERAEFDVYVRWYDPQGRIDVTDNSAWTTHSGAANVANSLAARYGAPVEWI